MRYDDASNTGSMAADSAPTARPDVDALPSNSFGPASGNAITGAGTVSGAAGADMVGDAPAKVVEVNGSGGPTSASGDGFQAAGQYGVLSMDTQGNFNYVRNAGTPDGVQDVFGYTIADADGSTSATTLTMNIGEAITLQAQNIVNLPAGVQMSDIKVVGRDLVITMPDGSQMVIPNGAVFVPQLVIGDVELPATNLASLLIDSEPQPAAGQLQSSGGNFENPVPPLDPGVPLGDLIPPTELAFPPIDIEEPGQFIDREPELIIEPVDGAPAVNAFSDVNEAGLPVRDGPEPEGTGEEAAAGDNGDNSETTTGVINITSPDGIAGVTINGELVTGTVGQEFVGLHGTLIITGFLPDGDIQYSYTLSDNTIGNDTHDDFEVIVTDSDGDTATGTLTIDIIDDVPIARNDTDAVAKGDDSTGGNVLTGVDTTSGAAGKDSPGADGFSGETNDDVDGVTAVQAGTSTTFDSSDSVNQDGSGKAVVGTFGTLTIHNDGSYTYVLTGNQGPGGNDVFTYQVTDGDGDTDTATLTITVPPNSIPVANNATAFVDDDGLSLGNHDSASGDEVQNPDPDGDESTFSGTLTANFGTDGPGTFAFGAGMNGTIVTIGQEQVIYSVVGNVLTATVAAGEDRAGTELFTVTLNANGSYDVELLNNILHTDDGSNTENNASAAITFTATDNNGDHDDAVLTIDFDDDIPVLVGEGNVSGAVGEDTLLGGNPDLGDTKTTTASGSLASLVDFGADQPGSFTFDPSAVTKMLALNLSSDSVALKYAIVGDLLIAYTGATSDDGRVFTLQVQVDGDYQFTLLDQIDHLPNSPADNDDQLLTIDFGDIVDATDSDGDQVDLDGRFNISIEDDIPEFVSERSITDAVGEDALVPDGNPDFGDTKTTTASGSLATLVSIGADQPGSFVFGSDAVAKMLALNLSSNSVSLKYAIVGDILIAYTGATSADGRVFTLEVQADGDYQFTLLDQIDHLPNVPANDDNQLLTIDFGDIIDAIDEDGDKLDLDGRFTIDIEDDIPTIPNEGSVNGAVGEDSLPGANPDAGDTKTTVASGSLSTIVDFGADQPGSFSFEATAVAEMLALNLTSNSVALKYAIVGDTLIAYTGATSADGRVFTLELQSDGDYRFTLLDQIDHLPNTPANDDNQNLVIDFGDIIDATDADGDKIDLDGAFHISIEDDIPIARNDTDDITGGGTTATGNVITGALTTTGVAGADSAGADAPITVVKIQGAGGSDETFESGVLSIGGAHGTLVIDANGEYTYTRTDNLGGVQDIFTYTIRDADGDITTATLTINVEDNTPTAGEVNAKVDDDGLAGGNPSGTGDINANFGEVGAGSADEKIWTGTLVKSGGDLPTTFLFQESLESVHTDTLGTETLEYVVSADGLTLQAFVDGGTRDGTLLFDIVITNASTGTYTLTLRDNVLHAPGGNDETSDTLTVPYQVMDSDGDLAAIAGQIHIEFNDDTPVVNEGSINAGVGEDTLAGGNPDAGDTKTTVASGSLSSAVSFGADGLGAFSFEATAVTEMLALNLTSNSVALKYAIVGDTLIAYTGATNADGRVFTLEVQADGDYRFTLLDQIDHLPNAPANDDNQNLTINFGNIIDATDADGDKVDLDGKFNVAIEDDIPILNEGTVNGLVGEDTLPGGNPDVGDTKTTIASGSLSSAVSFGADQPGSFSFEGTAVAEMLALGLTSNNVALKYAIVGDLLVAYTGATNADGRVFTLEVQSDGDYRFTLLDQIDHLPNTPANDDNQNLTINFGNIIDATDADGDKVDLDGKFNVAIEDDIPTIGAIDDGTANNLPGALHSFGDLNFSVGADQPGTVTGITLTTTATSGNRPIVTQFDSATGILTAYQDVGPAGYDAGDTTVVFRLTVDPDAGTTGQWEFDLVTALDSVTTPVDIGGSSSFGAGPTLGQILESGTGTDLAVISGYHSSGTFNFATWFANGTLTEANVTAAGVNGSTAGWGVDDNNFGNQTEIMFFDFGDEPLADPDGTEAYAPPATSLPQISFATFDFINYKDGAGNLGDDIAYVVHLVNADGTPAGTVNGWVPDSAFDGSSNAEATNWTFTAPSGKFIGDIQFYSGANPDGSVQDLAPGKIDLVRVGVETTSINKNLTFDVTLSDADGDTVSDSFTINVSDGNSPSTLAALNDNQTQLRTSNTMIMAGALAAAGLATEPLAAESTHDRTSSRDEQGGTLDDQSALRVDSKPEEHTRSVDGLDKAAAKDSKDAAEDLRPAHEDAGAQDKGVATENAPTHAVSELSAGTDAPSQSDAQAPATAMAQAVAMPSAEQLAAAGKGGDSKSVGGDDAKGDDVGKVLADALHGGDGKDLDALINAVSGQDNGAHNAHDALATHGSGHVSNGDMAALAGFSGLHSPDIMTQVTMHQDAAPAHA